MSYPGHKGLSSGESSADAITTHFKKKIALVSTDHRNAKTVKEFDPPDSLEKFPENLTVVTKKQEREKR